MSDVLRNWKAWKVPVEDRRFTAVFKLFQRSRPALFRTIEKPGVVWRLCGDQPMHPGEGGLTVVGSVPAPEVVAEYALWVKQVCRPLPPSSPATPSHDSACGLRALDAYPALRPPPGAGLSRCMHVALLPRRLTPPPTLSQASIYLAICAGASPDLTLIRLGQHRNLAPMALPMPDCALAPGGLEALHHHDKGHCVALWVADKQVCTLACRIIPSD